MIGNDLVFLPEWGKQSAGRKERFRSKLFTPAEVKFIHQSGRSFSEALLWSMKESAYKIQYRQEHIDLYNPKRFQTDISNLGDEMAEGVVHFGKYSFLTRTYFLNDYVHSIALPMAEVDRFNEVKILLKEYVKGEARLIKDERYDQKLEVRKDAFGVPQLFLGERLTQHPVSVSHDGHKIAFAWL